jgi:hypothetical protein
MTVVAPNVSVFGQDTNLLTVNLVGMILHLYFTYISFLSLHFVFFFLFFFCLLVCCLFVFLFVCLFVAFWHLLFLICSFCQWNILGRHAESIHLFPSRGAGREWAYTGTITGTYSHTESCAYYEHCRAFLWFIRTNTGADHWIEYDWLATTYLSVYLFLYLCIYLFIYLFMYLFISFFLYFFSFFLYLVIYSLFIYEKFSFFIIYEKFLSFFFPFFLSYLSVAHSKMILCGLGSFGLSLA